MHDPLIRSLASNGKVKSAATRGPGFSWPGSAPQAAVFSGFQYLTVPLNTSYPPPGTALAPSWTTPVAPDDTSRPTRKTHAEPPGPERLSIRARCHLRVSRDDRLAPVGHY